MPAVAFEDYTAQMRPYVRRAVERWARTGHPELSYADLTQEGLLALWLVWRRHGGRVPVPELCRMGTTAVHRTLRDLQGRRLVHRRARLVVGRMERLPLSIAGQGTPEAAAHVSLALRAAARGLDRMERVALRELVAPSERLVRVTVAQWRRRKLPGPGLATVAKALALAYGVPYAMARRALMRARGVLYHILTNPDHASIAPAMDPNHSRGGPMKTDVDDLFTDLPEGNGAAAPAKAKKAKAPKVKAKAAAKEAKAEAAPAAEAKPKAKVVSIKAKAPKAPKVKAKAPKAAKAKAPKKAASANGSGVPEFKPGSQGAKVVKMLERSKGATTKELMEAMGWVSHTVRGWISVHKAKGLPVTRGEDGRYRIE